MSECTHMQELLDETRRQLKDAEAQIMRLKRDITEGFTAKDAEIERLRTMLLIEMRDSTNGDPWSRQVSIHSWKVFRKWYWQVLYKDRLSDRVSGYCFTKNGAYKKAGMEQ